MIDIDVNSVEFLENDGENREKLGQFPLILDSEYIQWALELRENLYDQQECPVWTDRDSVYL